MKADSLHRLNRFGLSLKEYQICIQLNEKDRELYSNHIKDAKKQINWLIMANKTGNSNVNACKQTKDEFTNSTADTNDQNHDEKSTETTVDDNMVEFNKLSVVDGIDEIMAQIIQIEQMIFYDNYNSTNKVAVKHHLSVVQNELANTRMKCTTVDEMTSINKPKKTQPRLDKSIQVDCNNSARNDLISQLDKLNKEIKI